MNPSAVPDAPKAPGLFDQMLGLRVLSALVLAAGALAGAVAGGWPAAVAAAVSMVVVHVEWIGLTEKALRPAVYYTAALVICLAFLAGGLLDTAALLVGVAVATAAVSSPHAWRPVGVAYAGAFALALLLLRYAPDLGLAAVVVVFAVVWATDTGAYFGGRTIGGPRLWPAISPHKTWSGALVGLVAGVVMGTLVAMAFGVALTVGLVAVLLALAAATEAGDLFESWVKRRVGAKDASRLVPGHGGLMDRVDGLAAAAMVGLAIGWVHSGGGGLATGLLAW